VWSFFKIHVFTSYTSCMPTSMIAHY
jgi:hypothetical protein